MMHLWFGVLSSSGLCRLSGLEPLWLRSAVLPLCSRTQKRPATTWAAYETQGPSNRAATVAATAAPSPSVTANSDRQLTLINAFTPQCAHNRNLSRR